MEPSGKIPAKSKGKPDFRTENERSISRTQQHYRDGTRIDNVLKRYQTQGVNPNDVGLFRAHVNQQEFGIADTTYDYQTQLNKIVEIKAKFNRLPSGIREKFRNDPARMLAFMADPKNLKASIEMGLLPGAEKLEEASKKLEAEKIAAATAAKAKADADLQAAIKAATAAKTQ